MDNKDHEVSNTGAEFRVTLPSKEVEKPKANIAVVGLGRVGKAFLQPDIGANVTALTRKSVQTPEGVKNVPDFDITGDPVELAKQLKELKANGVETVINTAGVVAISQAVEDQRNSANPQDSEAYRINVIGARNLALACREAGVKLIHLSTESVFGTDREEKYTEADQPDLSPPYFDAAAGRALSYYGETKALGEQEVLKAYPEGAVIARMHGVQGPAGGLFALTLKELMGDKPITRANNAVSAHLTDASIREAILAIEKRLNDPEQKTAPIYNISGSSAMTPFAMAERFAKRLAERGIETPPITANTQEEFVAAEAEKGNIVVPRSKQVILDTSLFAKDFYPLSKTEDEIDKYVDLYAPKSQTSQAA
jgi:dTDP-4-dehydrorhamnose reductase